MSTDYFYTQSSISSPMHASFDCMVSTLSERARSYYHREEIRTLYHRVCVSDQCRSVLPVGDVMASFNAAVSQWNSAVAGWDEAVHASKAHMDTMLDRWYFLLRAPKILSQLDIGDREVAPMPAHPDWLSMAQALRFTSDEYPLATNWSTSDAVVSSRLGSTVQFDETATVTLAPIWVRGNGYSHKFYAQGRCTDILRVKTTYSPIGLIAMQNGWTPWNKTVTMPLDQALLVAEAGKDAEHPDSRMYYNRGWKSVKVKPHGILGSTLLSLMPTTAKAGHLSLFERKNDYLWDAALAVAST